MLNRDLLLNDLVAEILKVPGMTDAATRHMYFPLGQLRASLPRLPNAHAETREVLWTLITVDVKLFDTYVDNVCELVANTALHARIQHAAKVFAAANAEVVTTVFAPGAPASFDLDELTNAALACIDRSAGDLCPLVVVTDCEQVIASLCNRLEQNWPTGYVSPVRVPFSRAQTRLRSLGSSIQDVVAALQDTDVLLHTGCFNRDPAQNFGVTLDTVLAEAVKIAVSPSRRLVLLAAVPEITSLPANVHVLGAPYFSPIHFITWLSNLIRLKRMPVSVLAEMRTDANRECGTDEPLDPHVVYAYLSRVSQMNSRAAFALT